LGWIGGAAYAWAWSLLWCRFNFRLDLGVEFDKAGEQRSNSTGAHE
jgi:hypothetical protein